MELESSNGSRRDSPVGAVIALTLVLSVSLVAALVLAPVAPTQKGAGVPVLTSAWGADHVYLYSTFSNAGYELAVRPPGANGFDYRVLAQGVGPSPGTYGVEDLLSKDRGQRNVEEAHLTMVDERLVVVATLRDPENGAYRRATWIEQEGGMVTVFVEGQRPEEELHDVIGSLRAASRIEFDSLLNVPAVAAVRVAPRFMVPGNTVVNMNWTGEQLLENRGGDAKGPELEADFIHDQAADDYVSQAALKRPGAVPLTVRGHNGFYVNLPGEGGGQLTWAEDGWVVTMNGAQNAAESLANANALVIATEDQWKHLLLDHYFV